MNDPVSARRLAAAVILCALKDAKGRKGGDRVEAIAWLASKKAAVYLDLVDIPQSTLLNRYGWKEWAIEEIYDDSHWPMTLDQALVISHTLEYLEDLEVSQSCNLESDTETMMSLTPQSSTSPTEDTQQRSTSGMA